MAHAAPSAKPGKPTPATAAKKPAAKTAPVATKRAAAVEPNYGFQKYRVGVQVKSGAYVPAGTTTAGTQVTVTDTTPATPGNPASTNTFTCTTDASTAQSGSTATFCKVPANIMQSQRAKLTKMANARTSLTVTPTPSGAPSDEQFFAAPGHTITLKQKTVNANLVIDPAIATIQPCEPPFPGFPACGTFGGETFEPKSTDVIFDDAGLPPKAVNDSAKTDAGKSVTIDVTNNDTTHGAPLKSLSIATDPKHGTVQVVSGNIRYTPKAGFAGTDTFRYTITTANGSSTATVTVLVVAPPPPPATPNTSSNEPLANTGGNTRSLMTIALGLLGAGAGTTALGRRRRPIARSGRVG